MAMNSTPRTEDLRRESGLSGPCGFAQRAGGSLRGHRRVLIGAIQMGAAAQVIRVIHLAQPVN
jgi:hypothetical protein